MAVILTGLTWLALASWISLAEGTNESWPATVIMSCLLAGEYVLGCALRYFDDVMEHAVASGGMRSPEPQPRSDRVVQCLLHWLGCFAAGPIVLIGGAAAYWLYSGTLTAVDYVILAELGVIATGWAGLSLLSRHVDAGVRIPSPWRVFRLTCTLGMAAAQFSVVGASLILGHAMLALFAISRMSDEPAVTALLLCVCWMSGLQLCRFSLRRLGCAYHHGRQRISSESIPQRGVPGNMQPVLR